MVLKRILILVAALLSGGSAYGQNGTLQGSVKAGGLPAEFAVLGLTGTTMGTTTDAKGNFTLAGIPAGSYTLQVIYSGYETYKKPVTVIADSAIALSITLKESPTTFNPVVITGTQQPVSKLESPIPVEVYHPTYFKKNPTPNIFEALSMVNGVQPQLNCNVCNTGDIHINGMEGPYTMVLIDGMPIVSSLATVYGLSGIPNSMIQRIEIVKGPASTLYGSEAVGGLINIITKDPSTAPVLGLDISGTTLQEYNADISTRFRLKKATSLLSVNGFASNDIHDINNDGFTDYTLQNRISIFNKWSFDRAQGKTSSIAGRYLYEDRWGGQTNYTREWRGTDSIYGESIITSRAEVIGSYSLPGKENFIFDYSYNYHLQDSYYGTTKYYATQHTAFGQLRWDKSILRHDLMAGLPFRFINYDDNTPGTSEGDSLGTNKPMLTYLPGIFVQDEIHFTERFTTLAGLRYDRHNAHGNIFSPRLALKFMPDKNNTVRLSGGNGFRVVNLFTEDHAALTGAREVVISETLKPEQSWNANLNYTGIFVHEHGFVGVDASLFYTWFANKIVGDFLSDPQKIIYGNLDGHAISKGATLNIDMSFTSGLKLISGITLMDVYQVDKDSLGNDVKSPQLFAPKFSGTFAVSYTIPKALIAVDFTGRINGPMYLPVVPNDFRPEQSPWYAILNVQLSRKFSGGVEVYAGVKNLLNFIPKDPILRPFDPFDKNITVDNPNGYTFDPSYNYAPVQGIKGVVGVRYNFFGKAQ